MAIVCSRFSIAQVRFGTTAEDGIPLDIRVLDPGEAYRWCAANGVDPSPFWGRANKIMYAYVGLASQPSYLLVSGQTAARLNATLNGAYKPSCASIEVRMHYSPTDTLEGYPAPGKFSAYRGMLFVTSCVNINPQHSGADGIYLLTLNDERYFWGKEYETYRSGSVESSFSSTMQFNFYQPGAVASPMSTMTDFHTHDNTTLQGMYNYAYARLVWPYRASPAGPSGDTLPAITESAFDITLTSGGKSLINYLEQLHNVTSSQLGDDAINLVDFNDSYATETITALNAFASRTMYSATSTANDYYEDYPELFVTSFQVRYAPFEFTKTIDTFYEFTKNTSVTLPSDSGVDPTFLNNKCLRVWSPVYAEVRKTSPGLDSTITPENDSDLQSLCDEYKDRFLSRVTTAHQRLHYVISGVALPQISGSFRLTSRLHEVFFRDYGDSTGFVTECMGGRDLLRARIGEPFSMLTKPLFMYPDLGYRRHPRQVSPTEAIGRCTSPTHGSNTTVTFTENGVDTAMGTGALYLGSTFVGSKKVYVFNAQLGTGGTGAYCM